MARIVDVAARAGVSTATVSRVLNGKQVRPELRSAVNQAIDELGYAPDRTARSLRRRHSDVIALIVPDIENPFFTSLARGVEDVAHESGLSVVLCNTDEDPAKQERYLRVADEDNVAGVILAPSGPSERLSKLQERGRAVVLVDRTMEGWEVDHVVFDNVELGRRATQSLIDRGFERIACITGPSETPTAVSRAQGWSQALAEAGLDSAAEPPLYANFRVDGGLKAMGELLERERSPEAVVATNNLVGVGALRALAAHARDQVGVGIIGDLPFVTSNVEDVSLLWLHPREMGLAAARLLVRRIQGETGDPRRIIQPTQDVVFGAGK